MVSFCEIDITMIIIHQDVNVEMDMTGPVKMTNYNRWIPIQGEESQNDMSIEFQKNFQTDITKIHSNKPKNPYLSDLTFE